MTDDICEEPPLVWCMQACLTQTVFDVALGLWSTRRLDALLKAAEGLARVPEDNMLSQCAVPLRDAHPGHTLLHSVLSSASLPHYSSSNFKREYALLQLACLELNLSRSLQWTALIWPLFLSPAFISPFVCVFPSLLCLLRLIWHLKVLMVGDRWGHFAYIFGQCDREGNSRLKYWKTFRGCGIQTWSRMGEDRKVEESNLCISFRFKQSRRNLGRSTLQPLTTAADNTSSQTQRKELVSIWDVSLEDYCLPRQPFLV